MNLDSRNVITCDTFCNLQRSVAWKIVEKEKKKTLRHQMMERNRVLEKETSK